MHPYSVTPKLKLFEPMPDHFFPFFHYALAIHNCLTVERLEPYDIAIRRNPQTGIKEPVHHYPLDPYVGFASDNPGRRFEEFGMSHKTGFAKAILEKPFPQAYNQLLVPDGNLSATKIGEFTTRQWVQKQIDFLHGSSGWNDFDGSDIYHTYAVFDPEVIDTPDGKTCFQDMRGFLVEWEGHPQLDQTDHGGTRLSWSLADRFNDQGFPYAHMVQPRYPAASLSYPGLRQMAVVLWTFPWQKPIDWKWLPAQEALCQEVEDMVRPRISYLDRLSAVRAAKP